MLSEGKYISYDSNNDELYMSNDTLHSNWKLDYKEAVYSFTRVDIYIDNIDTILSYDSDYNVMYYEDFDIGGKWLLEKLGDNLYIIRSYEDLNKVLSVEGDTLKIVDINYEDNQKFEFVKK